MLCVQTETLETEEPHSHHGKDNIKAFLKDKMYILSTYDTFIQCRHARWGFCRHQHLTQIHTLQGTELTNTCCYLACSPPSIKWSTFPSSNNWRHFRGNGAPHHTSVTCLPTGLQVANQYILHCSLLSPKLTSLHCCHTPAGMISILGLFCGTKHFFAFRSPKFAYFGALRIKRFYPVFSQPPSP